MSESLLRLIAENRVEAKDTNAIALFHAIACINKYFAGVSGTYINHTLTQKYIAETLSKAVYKNVCETLFFPRGFGSVCNVLCKDSAAEYKKLCSLQITITARTLNFWGIMSGSAVLRYAN